MGGSKRTSGRFAEKNNLLPLWDSYPGWSSPWPSYNTFNRRYPTSRFAIFRYSDSQTLIDETRYPPQIPAVATPRPTELHITYYSFPIYNNGKYGPAIRFFATRPVFRHELESDNES